VLESPTESAPVAAPRQITQVKHAPAPRVESQPEEKPHLPASEKPVLNVNEVTKSWKALISALPKTHGNLNGLLNSVRMIDVEGKTLVLGMASDVLVEKINKPDQIEMIQKLIKDRFGIEVAVRCIVTNAKGKIPANVPQDGMVAAAIQHGGEVVDVD
jgi:hypothetical protein